MDTTHAETDPPDTTDLLARIKKLEDRMKLHEQAIEHLAGADDD